MKSRCCRQPTFTDPPRFPLDVILSDYSSVRPPRQLLPTHTIPSTLSTVSAVCSSIYVSSDKAQTVLLFGELRPTNRHISETLTLRPSLIRVDYCMSTGTPTMASHHLILPSNFVMNTLLRWSNHPTPLWRDGAGMRPLHATFQGNSVALIVSMGPWFWPHSALRLLLESDCLLLRTKFRAFSE